MMKRITHKHTYGARRGFTLIEALVAITLMLLAIAGPMSIAQSGIRNSIFAKDQIVAFYIAQEGIEIIRAIRDGNGLDPTSTSWLEGIPLSGAGANCTKTAGCGVDIVNQNFIDCEPNSGAACNVLYNENGFDAGSGNPRGIYSHDTSGSSQQTVYNRSIHIDEVVAGEEVIINSTVTWLSRGTTKTITVQSRMFDQYDAI